jgi:nickel transport protein
VTVLDKQGSKLLEGKTDKDGFFSFQIPQYADLRIVLTASMGHRAEYILRKSELSLTPIKKIIEKNHRNPGPSLTEVLGGIGYIFGIMGLVIFFKNKKNK